jgi:hypothetical protein
MELLLILKEKFGYFSKTKIQFMISLKLKSRLE